MTDERQYQFLVELEELLGVRISNRRARDAANAKGVAELIERSSQGDGSLSQKIALGKFYLRLRLAVSQVFRLPQVAIRPSSEWKRLMPSEHPMHCRRLWRALRANVGSGLPRLRPLLWPWIVIDFVAVPILTVYCQRRTANWLPCSLLVFVLATLLAVAMSMLLASVVPHRTIGETAKYMAEHATTSPVKSAGEIEEIVRSLVAAELGKAIVDEIPFDELKI